MNRDRNYYREMRKKHIDSRRKLDKEISDFPMYSCNGKYSKGKIHCSCPLCRAKTKTEGYKISDYRKIQKMNYDETKEKDYDWFSENYDEEIFY